MEVFELLNDEDEEFIQFLEYERRPYVVEERENYFDTLDDVDFFTRFRLTKQTVLYILHRIEHAIETITNRNHTIAPIQQLLLTLRFYATGNFLVTVADFIKVSKSSASNIVKKVSHAIASLAPEFIKMPTTENEIRSTQMEFFRKARLPRVIGSIDCTHIKIIQSPGAPQAELFRNRKGYFSINVQTVASTHLKILDIVARWPGSTHDQIIFDNSSIKRRLENNVFGSSLLVGDSGYANTRHVITPLLRAENEVQQLYNESVTRTRNPVERQYGVWKRRFPILALGIRLKLETTLAVIVSTAVLHNIATNQHEQIPPADPEVNVENINFDADFDMDPPEVYYLGNARDYLLNEYFPGLLH